VMQRIEDGIIGRPQSVRASFGTPFLAGGRRAKPSDAGSFLLDRGIYAATLAHWFLGEPESVTAGGTIVDGVDVSGHATLGYGGGRFASIAWSGVGFLDLSASVSGETGWITLDPMFWAGSSAQIRAGSYERIFVEPELVIHPRQGNGYGPMLEAVRDAVNEMRLEHPWHGRSETAAVARTLDAIGDAIRAV